MNTGGRFPHVRRHLPERPVSLDVLGARRSSAVGQPDAVLPRRAGGGVPPDHHVRRPHSSEQQLRFRRAARLLRRRPHLDHEPAHDQRHSACSTPMPSTKWRRPTATAPGSRATSAPIASDYCTAIFNYPSLALGGCGNSQMGPGEALGAPRRLRVDDRETRISSRPGADLSVISFRRTTSVRRSVRGRSRAMPSTTPTTPRPFRPSTPTRCRPTPRSRQARLPLYIAGRLAAGIDAHPEPRAALRPPARLVQRGSDGVCSADIGDKLGPHVRDLPAAGSVPSGRGSTRRRQQLRSARRSGVGRRRRRPHQPSHAGYGLFYENMRTLQNFGELTWPQARQIIISNPSFPDALQGRSRDQFVSTAPPNITVDGQRQRQRLRASIQRRRARGWWAPISASPPT